MEALLNSIDQVFLLELLMLSAIMAAGCYTSYTDIHFREISNLATWGLLALGLAGQLGFWALGKTAPLQIGVTFLAGFGISYLLYLYGFWAPGDAKLFWAMTVALPPTLFSNVGTPDPGSSLFWSESFFSFRFPLWAFLINTMLINFGFLMLTLALQRMRHPHPSPGATSAKVPLASYLRSALELGGLSGLVLGVAMMVLGRALTFTEATGAVLVLYLVTERLIPQDYRLILVVPGLILGFYVSLGPQTWPIYVALWGVTWAIQTIYLQLHTRASRAFAKVLPIHALQQGMVPHLAICSTSAPNPTPSYFCTEEVSDGQEVVCHPGRPLSARKVQQLQEMTEKGLFKNFGDRLEVELSLPFAPTLVGGMVFTIVLTDSLINPVTSLLRQWAVVLSQ